MPFATATKNPILSQLAGHRDTNLGDLGFYFTARTPTVGTGIVTATSVNTFAETTPTLVLYNPGPLSVYPMWFRTHITVIGVDATPLVVNWTITLDVGNRYTSGGTQLTIQNENMLTTNTSEAFVAVGAVTATAATAKRRIIANLISKDTVLEVVHDTMTIMWGDTLAAAAESVVSNAAAPAYANYSLPPCVVGPNCSMTMVAWSATQTTGSTREYALSWVEK